MMLNGRNFGVQLGKLRPPTLPELVGTMYLLPPSCCSLSLSLSLEYVYRFLLLQEDAVPPGTSKKGNGGETRADIRM